MKIIRLSTVLLALFPYFTSTASTQKNLAASQPTDKPRYIHVDLTQQKATLVDNDKTLWESPITSGREAKPTPVGEFTVTNKHKDWTSNLYYVPMPFFLRLSHGDFGLHAGPMPGYPGSAGCIRLPRDKAEMLFNMADIGTHVVITGTAPTIAEIRERRKKDKIKEQKRITEMRIRR